MRGRENEEEGPNAHHNFIAMDKRALVRLAVSLVNLWLIVLLVLLLVVVGMYTSQANQIIVVSSVAVISAAVVIAYLKLNSIADLSKVCVYVSVYGRFCMLKCI